jgi:8-oxo-dGTP pyrophosphatase MutT (NUDIX family)
MSKENKKRITAHLIPFKVENGEFFFYLQKRSENALRNPGWFTIFGGGVENEENKEQAMLREIKEELDFIPDTYSYLGEYADEYSISYYYATEVENDFTKNIKVKEGDYGRFFSEKEIENENELTDSNKRILKDLITKIK